jgi:hypothetical protein
MNLLAETTAAAADPMISGNWIIGFLGAAGTLLGVILGHKNGKASQSVTLATPLPEMPFRKMLTPPSWDAHKALCDRVSALELATSELRRETTHQYQEILKAGGEREVHLSDKLDGIARGIHARIDEILQTRTRAR